MFICLGINEDIQSTFKRYDQFKKQIKPQAFISSFLNEYSDCNLLANSSSNQESKNQNDLIGEGSSNSQNNQVNQNEGKNYIKDLNDLF